MEKLLIATCIAACLLSLFDSLLPGSPRNKPQMSIPLSESLKSELQAVAARLATNGKGLLAADESTSTIGKRFEKAGLKNEEEERRAYRELYMTSPGIGQYISGVIMFKETLYQKTSGAVQNWAATLSSALGLWTSLACFRGEAQASQACSPFHLLDCLQGLQALATGLEGETWTKGLENLAAAAKEYKAA
eukprot:1161744-Pelagomonas_calceolata.AAC.20